MLSYLAGNSRRGVSNWKIRVSRILGLPKKEGPRHAPLGDRIFQESVVLLNIRRVRATPLENEGSCDKLGDRIFRENSEPGNARVCGSGKATAIWSFRHCKPAACILGLTGASMRLSLICGFPWWSSHLIPGTAIASTNIFHAYPVVHGVYLLDLKGQKTDPSRANVSKFIDLAANQCSEQ